jgi:very-short-patch-repair endonuclease
MFILRKRPRRMAALANINESTQSNVIWATYSHAWHQIVVSWCSGCLCVEKRVIIQVDGQQHINEFGLDGVSFSKRQER